MWVQSITRAQTPTWHPRIKSACLFGGAGEMGVRIVCEATTMVQQRVTVLMDEVSMTTNFVGHVDPQTRIGLLCAPIRMTSL